jgi:hypothetical protein
MPVVGAPPQIATAAEAQPMQAAQLAALRAQLAPIYGDPGAVQARPQLGMAPEAAGYQRPSLQAPAPAEAAPMPWVQQWRQYLQQQAAYQQQLAQQMHGLGPLGNQLTLPAINQMVSARRNEVLQALMGAPGGARALGVPGIGPGGQPLP